MNLKQEMNKVLGGPVPFEDDKSPEGRRFHEFFAKDRERLQELEALRGMLPEAVIDAAKADGRTAHDLWMEIADKVQAVEDKHSNEALMKRGEAMAEKLRREGNGRY